MRYPANVFVGDWWWLLTNPVEEENRAEPNLAADLVDLEKKLSTSFCAGPATTPPPRTVKSRMTDTDAGGARILANKPAPTRNETAVTCDTMPDRVAWPGSVLFTLPF